MKLISTVFRGEQLEAKIMIQNRIQQRPGEQPQDGPLVTKYVSRVGNESLIFNPTVALSIDGKADRTINAYIPLTLFYRFAGNLSAVYEALNDAKLYRVDGPIMYVDKKRALECARKLPLFRNTLSLVPDVYVDRSNVYSKGILFQVEMKPIGVLHHQEVLGLIEQLDHLDITSFSLIAGVIDELDGANQRLDMILDLQQKIYAALLKLDPTSVTNTQPKSTLLQWTDTVDWRPMR